MRVQKIIKIIPEQNGLYGDTGGNLLKKKKKIFFDNGYQKTYKCQQKSFLTSAISGASVNLFVELTLI